MALAAPGPQPVRTAPVPPFAEPLRFAPFPFHIADPPLRPFGPEDRAILALLLLAPAALAAGSRRIPYHGDDAPDAIVAGTMPENYLPGLMEIIQSALKQSPTMIVQQIQIAQAEASAC